MRIKQIKIYGFGKWVDVEWTLPDEGPLVFYGENESGKSTLHTFILFILFGLAPRQRKNFQPKQSSKLGGSLLLSDETIGNFTIERLDEKNNGQATCYLPNGIEQDEKWLQSYLQGLDKKTYEAIFFFSSLELSEITTMNEEDLGEILLGIGMTGSNNIYQIERQLDTRIGELFKKNGKNPTINQQLDTLVQLTKQLVKSKQDEASYRDKTEKIVRLRQEIEQLKEEMTGLQKEKMTLLKHQTALPIIREYQYLQSKEAEFETEPAFPNNGIERLEKVKEKLQPLESDYSALVNQLERSREKQKKVKESMLSNEKKTCFKKVKNELDYILRNKQEINRLEEKKQMFAQEIEMEARDLHLFPYITHLDDITLPFYAEEAWKQLKIEKETLDLNEINIETEGKSLQEEAIYFQEEQKRLQSELLRDDQVVTMKRNITEAKEFHQFSLWQERTQRKKIDLEESKRVEQKRSRIILGTSILLSIVSFIIGWNAQENLFFIIAIILIIVGVSQLLMVKRNWNRLEELSFLPENLEKTSNLSHKDIADMEEQLLNNDAIRHELDLLKAESKKHHIQMVKWEEKQRIFLERKNRLEQQVEDQIILYPFLEQIDVVYWLEYYQRLNSLLKTNESYQEVNEALESYIHDENQRMKHIKDSLKSYGDMLEITDESELLEGITHTLENHERLRERYAEEEIELKRLLSEIEDVEKRMEVFQIEREQLYALANVDREEDFYHNATYLSDRNAYMLALEENNKQLNIIFPEETWQSVINTQYNEWELKEHIDDLEEQLNLKEIEETNLRDELSILYAERNQLESQGVYSERMHHLEIEKEKLHQLAEEWAVLKIEREILRETKHQYREKYLTQIMDETTTFFEKITSGAYKQVYAPVEKETFLVVSKEDIRYYVHELSQGTIHQLYVALRLAINKVMAENFKLPFILDDAFIHFDALRTEKMMHVLTEIAKTQQVILLTFQQDIAEISETLHITVEKLK